MFIVTNRKLNPDKNDLSVFGSIPNERGPNELRLVKADNLEAKIKTEILGDQLTAAEVKNLKEQYDLNIDVKQDWFVSLKVACEIFSEAQATKKHVLIYVHGYNNDVNDIIKTAKQLQELYDVIVVPFTWPANGGGALTGAASYKSDKSDARASTDALNRFIEKINYYHALLSENRNNRLWQKAIQKHKENHEAARQVYVDLLNRDCKVSVNLLCHSMGNYLFKYALFPGNSPASRLIFDNVCLVAADTNNQAHHEWVQKLQVRNRLYIVINENDFALKWSRRKPGGEQLARLGHYLKNLNADNAFYLDVTDAAKVKNEHSYFYGDPVKKNAELKKVFKNLFEGRSIETELTYRSDINVYKVK